MKKPLPFSVADLITAARIPLALSLLVILPRTWAFFAVYLLCGVTDVTDGFVARKMGTANERGARLDSFADILFTGIAIWRILPDMQISRITAALALTCAAVRGAAIWVTWRKFRHFGLLHTWLNKAAGMLLFLCPFALFTKNPGDIAFWIALVALLSALEELAIQCVAQFDHPNRKSLFFD